MKKLTALYKNNLTLFYLLLYIITETELAYTL